MNVNIRSEVTTQEILELLERMESWIKRLKELGVEG